MLEGCFKKLCNKTSSFTSTKELGSFVLNEILEQTSSKYALISFFDAETHKLVTEVSKGFSFELPPTRVGHGPLGIAMKTGKTVAGEYGKFPRVLPSLAQELGPIVAVPLIFEGNVVGAVGVGRAKGESPYTTQEVELIEGVSCAVTPLFIHRRHVVRNSLRNRRISGINRLFARLIKCETKESLLEESLSHAIKLFRARGGGIMLMLSHGMALVKSQGMKRPPTFDEIKRGITSEVMLSKKAVRLADYVDHSRAVRQLCEDNNIGSIMVVPLLGGEGNLLGVLVIYREKGEAPFSKDDEAEFKLFCHHVGLALDQKELLDNLKLQLTTQETVFSTIQRLLTEVGDPNELVKTLLERAVELLNADFAGYHIWVPGRGMLVPVYQIGFDFKLPEMRIGEGLAGMAVAKKDVVMVTSYENEVACESSAKAFGAIVKSAVSVPLLYKEGILGSITVGRGKDKPPFEEKDVPILKLFGVVSSSVLGYTRAFDNIKKREERLEKIQRLEALGTLGVGIAHDFNNVLTGVVGYLEMAKEELDPSHPASFGVNGAIKLVDRATALAKQILSVAGRGGGESTVLNPVPQLKELVKMAKSTFPKNINVHLDLEKDLPSIFVDPTQFHQVVLNIMVNAKDAMPNGGELRVVVREREISEEDNMTHPELKIGRYLVISISDTGNGIPEEYIDKIFEPGFTTKEEGTGWGLFTVFSVVKEMGGTVTVYSQLGIGSTFRIYIPVAESTAKESQKEDLFEKALLDTPKGRNLLIVDDEEVLLENAKLLLGKMGYKVVTANNGNAALNIYREHWRKIDVVVLDMVMPGMNGLEVFMAMKQINPDVKALFVSGHAANSLIEKATNLGAKRFLMKPYTFKELSAAIEEILSK